MDDQAKKDLFKARFCINLQQQLKNLRDMQTTEQGKEIFRVLIHHVEHMYEHKGNMVIVQNMIPENLLRSVIKTTEEECDTSITD